MDYSSSVQHITFFKIPHIVMKLITFFDICPSNNWAGSSHWLMRSDSICKKNDNSSSAIKENPFKMRVALYSWTSSWRSLHLLLVVVCQRSPPLRFFYLLYLRTLFVTITDKIRSALLTRWWHWICLSSNPQIRFRANHVICSAKFWTFTNSMPPRVR